MNTTTEERRTDGDEKEGRNRACETFVEENENLFNSFIIVLVVS